MRVVVTGAAGYIGSVTVERLIEAGHEVIALDDLSRGHRSAVHPSAQFVRCDLRTAAAVSEAIQLSRAEAVIHFAALTLVGESVERPAEYFQTNLVGGLNLLEATRLAEIGRFVFSSTAAVYGEPEQLPIREDDDKRPISPYGQTKWMMEQAIAAYAERYAINYAAFRYFNVAGATEARGEDHRPETHVVPVALSTVLGTRELFTINGNDFSTPDGTAIRDYVHVVDLADAHVAALERLDRSLGPINLGTKTGFSVKQIVDAVEEVTGRRLPVAFGPRRAGDPAALVADAARARELIDWAPHRSTMNEMIESAWHWHVRHPSGYAD